MCRITSCYLHLFFFFYSSDDFATRKSNRLGGKSRYATSELSSKPSQLALSKEARKAAFDKRRSKSIAAVMEEDDSKDSESVESSDSSDESSDGKLKILSFNVMGKLLTLNLFS